MSKGRIGRRKGEVVLDSGIAIDISNYTGRLDEWDLDWLQGNAQLVIVRLSTEDNHGQRDIAEQQVSALAGRGIPWQGYLWAYWSDDPFDHWQRVKERLPEGWHGYYGRNIWIDLEDFEQPAIATLAWVMAYAEMLRAEDFLPGVYLGEWWADAEREAFEGGRAELWTRYPLWFARYNGYRTCQPQGTAPWASVAMHQFESVDQGPVLASYDRSLICKVE